MVTEDPTATLERTVAQQLVLLHLRLIRHRAAVIAELADELAMTVDDTLTAVGTLGQEGLVRMVPSPSYAQRSGQIPISRMCVTCRFFDPYVHAGTGLPHHCHLVDAPFGNRQLRLRCPEAQPRTD
jgi:hypothetical protein